MRFTSIDIDYMRSQDLGRLATVQRDGTVQVNPVMFRYNADLDTIDIGGHSWPPPASSTTWPATPAWRS